MSKRTRILLAALVCLAAGALCWAYAAFPAYAAWADQREWALGALSGFVVGRVSRGRLITRIRRR